MAKKKCGIVYSTNPDFAYQYEGDEPEQETLAPEKQKLRVRLERKQRGGKVATVVSGFIGSEADLQELGRMLKTKCGVGGSAKEGEIVIQGELCAKVVDLLKAAGYSNSK